MHSVASLVLVTSINRIEVTKTRLMIFLSQEKSVLLSSPLIYAKKVLSYSVVLQALSVILENCR